MSNVPKGRRKQSDFEAAHQFIKLRSDVTDSDTGKVLKRINPKNVTRERRKIKAYKRLFDDGKMSYDDVEQSVKSWMGSFYKLMSKKQIENIKALYQELFGRELHWKKQQSNLKTAKHSKPK